MFLVSSLTVPVFILKLRLRISLATFEELVRRNGWGVSPPEIDLDHLRDEDNLPQGNTGKWIFEDAGYRVWRESRISKLLWLCGGPGTGKTMLAKAVASKFVGGPSLNGVKLAFHFVSPELPANGNYADEDQLSQPRLAKVARDLLYSMLQQDGSLFDGCKAELGKQGDRFFTNPCSLWKVLRKAIRDCHTNPVYILIDGMDKLGGRSHEELINKILGLMEIRTVKIFLSCRDVPYISNNLPRNPYKCRKINLDTNSFVKEDVETFIWRKVNAWGWPIEQRDKARKYLEAKSDGIFLWASLAVKSLSYFYSGLDFDEFLRKLPLELADVYRTMLDKLLRGGQQKVLNMIQSVALALRPLTFDELSYIMACIEGKARKEELPCYKTASSEICPKSEQEIRMYVQSSMGFLRATDTTVSIVHHTAIEYLFDENRKDNLPVLSKSEADFTISWECFRYLHHAFGDPEKLPERAVSGHCNGSRDSSLGRHLQETEAGETSWEATRKDIHEAVAKWPYLRYAAESWFIHARRSIEVSKDNFRDDSTYTWLQHQFFATSDAIRKPWIEFCEDPRMEVLAGEPTPLHIAICLGLTPLVEKILRDFPEGANNKWSLHLAARFTSGAFKILIAKCKRYVCTDPDQCGNTPLHEAAISGHSLMLKDLIKKLRGDRMCSDEVNKTNHSGNTPLHLAFQFDHPEIVDLLVKAGADQTIKNKAQLTASELGAKLERGESLDILKQDKGEGAEAKEVLKEPPYLGGNPPGSSTILSSSNTNIENNHSTQRTYCASRQPNLSLVVLFDTYD